MPIDMQGLDVVMRNLESFPKKLKAALAMDSQNIAYSMEAWAKSNAPWTDRTGHARQFLRSTVKWQNSDTLMISLSHHANYGIYLELCNAGRYAILEKAIAQYAPQFINSWKSVMLSLGN